MMTWLFIGGYLAASVLVCVIFANFAHEGEREKEERRDG